MYRVDKKIKAKMKIQACNSKTKGDNPIISNKTSKKL